MPALVPVAREQSPLPWRAQWQAEGTRIQKQHYHSHYCTGYIFFSPREESNYIYPQESFILKKTFLIKNTVEVKFTRSL